jgi:hypothetical protein
MQGRTAAGVSDSMATMRRSLAALLAAAVGVAACGGSSQEKPRRPTPPLAALQPLGRYSYATDGFERLSAVFSSRHVYPGASPVAVRRTSCGFSEHWQPRAERSTDWRFCVNGRRWRLIGLVDYHEFFGQAVTQSFACRGPFVPRPPTVGVGFRWTDRCRGAGSRVTVSYAAVRLQVLRVAGKRVETVLIRARARLRGRIDGLTVYDSWLSHQNGLLIRRAVRSKTAIDTPFGKVGDSERYALRLRAPVPG